MQLRRWSQAVLAASTGCQASAGDRKDGADREAAAESEVGRCWLGRGAASLSDACRQHSGKAFARVPRPAFAQLIDVRRASVTIKETSPPSPRARPHFPPIVGRALQATLSPPFFFTFGQNWPYSPIMC